jgi:FG-GAP repeat
MASTLSSSWLPLLVALAPLVHGCSLDSRKLVPDRDAARPPNDEQEEPADEMSSEPVLAPPPDAATDTEQSARDPDGVSDEGTAHDEAGDGEEVTVADAGVAATPCCTLPGDPDDECLPLDEEACLAEAARLAQIRVMLRGVVRSQAFAQCLNSVMRSGSANVQTFADAIASGGCGYAQSYAQSGHGPYVSCRPEAASQFGGVAGGESSGDAAWNELVDRQLARALNALQFDVQFVLRPGPADGPVAIASGFDPATGVSHVDYTGGVRGFTLEDAVGPTGDVRGFVAAVVRASLRNFGYDDGCRAGEQPVGTDHGNCGRDPTAWHPDRTLSHVAAFCAKEMLLRSVTAPVAGLAICGTEGSGQQETLQSCDRGGTLLASSYHPALLGDLVTCQCVPAAEAFGQNAARDAFGAALAAGDFDGDSIQDLAVGAPNESLGQGSVFVYRGSRTGLHPWRSFRSADLGLVAGESHCGAALATGNFDGDLAEDLVIGCPDHDGAGAVVIVRGCALHCDEGRPGLQIRLAQVLTPVEPGEFGYALATGKFLGDDGLDDLAVGAPSAQGVVRAAGRVDRFQGRDTGLVLDPQPANSLLGQDNLDRFGAALTAGEVQQAPGEELIVGAPARDQKGAVYITSAAGTLSISPPGLETDAQFGAALATGDVFGDYFEDILIAASGEATIYRAIGASAGPSPVVAAVTYPRGFDYAPRALAVAADFPYGGVVVGHPAANEVILHRSSGDALTAGERLGPRARPFWSAPHDARDGGHCTARADGASDVPCPIDQVSFVGASIGTALAVGSFGNLLPQIALGAPAESVGVRSQTAAGAVYVRGGARFFDLPSGAVVDPLEYRLDQEATFYAGAHDARRFGAGVKWHDDLCEAGATCFLFDELGDDHTDLVVFSKDLPGKQGDVWIARQNDSFQGLPPGFGALQLWHESFCTGQEVCAVADVDGNGDDELVAFVQDASAGHANHVHVVQCPNCAIEEWHDDLCRAGTVCRTGRLGGGQNPVLVEFDPRTGTQRIGVSRGSHFELASGTFTGAFCAPGNQCLLADVNGDGQSDVVDLRPGAGGQVWVGLGQLDLVGPGSLTGFGPPQKWHSGLCTSSRECHVGDVNNDSYADLVAFERGATPDSAGGVWVALSNRTDFGPAEKWHDDLCRAGQICLLGDVDTDFRADVVVLAGSTPGRERDAYVALSTR